MLRSRRLASAPLKDVPPVHPTPPRACKGRFSVPTDIHRNPSLRIFTRPGRALPMFVRIDLPQDEGNPQKEIVRCSDSSLVPFVLSDSRRRCVVAAPGTT